MVDLDAARGSSGQAHNRDQLAAICASVSIPVQVGGGFRTLEDIDEALALGASRVILGTAAARSPDLVQTAVQRFSATVIVAGIDAMEGEVRTDGWTQGSGIDAIVLALAKERCGVQRLIYTDIGRDGTM